LNKKMAITLAALLLPGILLLSHNFRQPDREKTYPPGDLIRLHVVANSDSAFDQELKRKVRDEIIRNVAPEFLEAGNIDSARRTARAGLGRIKEIAAREVKAAGKDYPVRVELDRFAFPTKHYGPFVLPAGDYEAVRVVIGAGGGANWWCVLFPPLCFVDMSKSVAVSEPEKAPPPPVAAIPPRDFTAAEEQQAAEEQRPVAAVPLQTGDMAGANGATPPEDGCVKVEFRFRILDFLQKFIG